jgi:hypothetical protein
MAICRTRLPKTDTQVARARRQDTARVAGGGTPATSAASLPGDLKLQTASQAAKKMRSYMDFGCDTTIAAIQ